MYVSFMLQKYQNVLVDTKKYLSIIQFLMLQVLHVVGVRTAYVPKVMQKPKSLYKPDHHWSTFRFYCGPSIVDHWIQLWGHLNDCEEQVTLNKHVDHFFFC